MGAIVLCLLGAPLTPAFAQQNAWRGGPPGHFPSGPRRGPDPVRAAPAPRRVQATPPAPVTAPTRPAERPHVDRSSRWVGHESGRADVRYHVDNPWPHGHFRGQIGRGHVYHLGGWDPPRHRFLFSHSFFIVGEPDWGYADDWNWNDDQIVLYDDPDHPGWYLAYNTRLGTYVHVEYDGEQ